MLKFGLEQQNHIETIEKILSDLGSNEYSWEKIGKQIGWYSKTACFYYVTYLQKRTEKQRIEGVLLGLSIAKKAWDKDLGRNEIYENEILYQEELAKLS